MKTRVRAFDLSIFIPTNYDVTSHIESFDLPAKTDHLHQLQLIQLNTRSGSVGYGDESGTKSMWVGRRSVGRRTRTRIIVIQTPIMPMGLMDHFKRAKIEEK